MGDSLRQEPASAKMRGSPRCDHPQSACCSEKVCGPRSAARRNTDALSAYPLSAIRYPLLSSTRQQPAQLLVLLEADRDLFLEIIGHDQ